MPASLTDVDAYTNPVNVPVDADPANAASVQTPFQALANRTLFMLNMLGGLALGEWVYRAVKTRNIVVPGACIAPNLALWKVVGGQYAQISTNGELGTIPLTSELRTGMVLGTVEIKCSTSTASAVGTRFKLYRATHTSSAITQIGTTQDSGASSGSKTVTFSALAETIDRSLYSYYVEITSSSTAATDPAGDRVISLKLTATDPGPRNH